MMNKNMQKLGFAFVVTFAFTVTCVHAQETRLQPQWWFGGGIGANLNSYSSDLRRLNTAVSVPASFSEGSGVGLSLAGLIEYRPDPLLGGMLTLGFDGRGGSFTDVSSAGVTHSLSTSMNYLSLEPSVLLSPFYDELHFFAGLRLGFNVAKTFTYTSSGNPAREEEWSGIRGAVVSGQFGAGYDIPLGSPDAETQLRLTPFMGVHVGQGPRSEESWTLTSIRLGVNIKFGSTGEVKRIVEREVQFSVRAPRIIPMERMVNETFPLRNYIFFQEGSIGIPDRYVTLTEEEARGFKEKHLIQPQPQDLTGRSRRQLKVYYNILNILGDRMRKYGRATVTLIGSSENGAAEGKAISETVKEYLVDRFGIEPSRIITEGREKPPIPSVQPGGTRELDLVRPEDRRVEITSESLELLQPVNIISLQDEPFDSYIIFSATRAQELLASWSLDLVDDAGSVRRLGPFTSDEERIPGKEILGNRQQARYTVVFVGQTHGGQSVRKEEPLRLVRSDQPEIERGFRFSILFEFDQSKTVATYEKFLTEVVTPLIPEGASVAIHGHTDLVGEESHNLNLSRDRSHQTMAVLERELAKTGKRRVQFDTYGFGEDPRRSPFENTLPEERFYNRTVIIDIIPG